MKTIPATLGYIIVVDDEDYDLLSKFRWYAHNCGGKTNPQKRPARRSSVKEGRKVHFLVHHLMRAPAGMNVDHINGDPWDNRRSNLRICTVAENTRNRRKHAGCSNTYKGVFRRGNFFFAIICHEGIRYDLGSYADEIATARLYDAAAKFLHGDFASLNFPDIPVTPRNPVEIREAWKAKRAAKRAGAVTRLVSGERATAVAASLGVSTTCVVKWAAAAGIKLRQGRPRLLPDAPSMRAA